MKLLAGLDLRRRWLSLAAVVLTVALVGGAVAAALAGARRTSTSIERFRDWADASDGNFQSNTVEEGASLRTFLATRPDVDGVAQRRLVNGFLEDQPISDIALITDPEGRYGVDVDRPRLLAGRMPATDEPNEIALNELAARLGELHVGDVVRIKTWSEDDLAALFTGTGFPGFNGPRSEMKVVGVVRTLDGLPGDIARTSPYALASPAFLAAHRGVGAWPPAIYVRTRAGVSFAKLSAAVDRTRLPRGVVDSTGDGTYAAGVPVRTAYLDASQKAADSGTWALVVFAIAAAIVGAIVVGQAILRHLAGSPPNESLAQLGLTRRRVALAFTIPVVVATVAGAFVGSLVAVLVSPLLPIGLARRAEVAPGIRVDPLVLLPSAVLMIVLVAAFAYVSSLRASGPRHLERRTRRDVLGGVRSTTPVFDTGVRFAVERRVGTRAVPVRTAFAALTVAVVGIAAAGVVSTSFTRLADEPARWGWNWSSEPDSFGDQDMAIVTKRLLADQRVAGVGKLVTGGVTVGGVETSSWALESLKGDIAMTLRRGRLPRSADEVALGERTLARAKTHVGATVRVASPGLPKGRPFMVVGTVVFRAQSENPVLDDGAAFTPEGFASLPQGDGVDSSLELRYPAGANVRALESALQKDYGFDFNAFTGPHVPGVVRNLSESRDVAVALALFFATLGTLALAHTLLVGTRRRRHDLAVLRTVGFRPAQVRGAVLVQASVLGLAALALGLPIGIALGRFIWNTLANDLGALDSPATPWVIVAVAVPVTVLWAVLLAAGPAWRASRLRVAEALHVE